MMSRSLFVTLAVALATVAVKADDWPSWRGPDATGVSSERTLPTRWSATENVAWKAPIAGVGISTPIVSGDRVFVTSQIGTGVSRQGPRLVQGGDAAAMGERALGSGRDETNPLVLRELQSEPLLNKTDVARRYGRALWRAYDDSKKQSAKISPEQKQLVDLVASRDSPCYFPKDQTRRYMSRSETDSFGGKLNSLDRMAVKSPVAPPRAGCWWPEGNPSGCRACPPTRGRTVRRALPG
jgi:hypothetical protein